MTLETQAAFREHGHARRTVDKDMEAAHRVIRRFEAAGFSLAAVTAQALTEGVVKFDQSLDQLMKLIETRRAQKLRYGEFIVQAQNDTRLGTDGDAVRATLA
jgi:hypothetical protein